MPIIVNDCNYLLMKCCNVYCISIHIVKPPLLLLYNQLFPSWLNLQSKPEKLFAVILFNDMMYDN
jgi:hypothetical protein